MRQISYCGLLPNENGRLALLALLCVALGLTGCAKKLSEEEAYGVFAADFEPKPIICRSQIARAYVEDNELTRTMRRLARDELHSTNDESRACIQYLAATGGISRMKCAEDGGCQGFPTGTWDADSHVLTFECGQWSKAHIDSITTREGTATVSFSRALIMKSDDKDSTAPEACSLKFDRKFAKGVVKATLDDSGKWNASE